MAATKTKVSEFFAMLSQRVPLVNYFYASVSISLLTIAVSLLSTTFLPPQVPLFYGAAEGEGQLVSSLGLAIPGAFSLLLSVFNTSISLAVSDKFLQKILVVTSLPVSLFALITTLKIIFLVGSF